MEQTVVKPEPICVGCNKLARNMNQLDFFIASSVHEVVTPEQRADYIRQEEGTYNTTNGHFLCDPCYITAGAPSSTWGWTAP